jgi:Kef-type K+ transport system membrane component KefB
VNEVVLVGFILIFALIGGHLIQLLRIPEVVGYFAVGLLMGPSFSRILTRDAVATLEFFSEIALGLILFSIGAIFDFENLRRVGRRTLLLTCYIVAGVVVIVSIVMLLFSREWPIALLLGTIAIEVSPIATVLVLRESNSEGPLTDAIYNVVALNNVGCLLAFGLATFVVRLFGGGGPDGFNAAVLGNEILLFLWSNIGAVALGVVAGYILAGWGRHVHEHGELLILVMGMLLIVVGGAHWLGVSSLIAAMTLGATLINLAPEARELFTVLGKSDPPLYAIFFVLAGAHLQLSSLLLIGLSGIGYTVARIIGKMAGAWFGARRLGYQPAVQKYLGVTLVAHAGVAIGLALQIRVTFPQYAEFISAVILGSVLINEVLGPVMTKIAISRAGETREEHAGAFEAV